MHTQNEKQSQLAAAAQFSDTVGKKQVGDAGAYIKDNRSQNVAQAKFTHLQDNRVKQLKANTTGLPNQLKTNIEALSGHTMDDVKVHYNSGKPAQLHAHAYAQGSAIHIAPGQEKHLPHEAWHVVQQKQGRVKPTLQFKSNININDTPALEHEADIMGAKAAQLRADNIKNEKPLKTSVLAGGEVLQPAWNIEEVLAILRSTQAGQAAAKRLIKHNIEIVQHPKDAVFKKYIVQGNKVVLRANPQFMDGFSEATKIHISNQMDAHHAAAMIVHESTHSVQKLPGGMIETNKAAKVPNKEIEYKMEEDAHLNQYQHELESGTLSEKGHAVLNRDGTGIDRKKLRAQIDGLYQTSDGMSDLEMEARKKTIAARKPDLNAFLGKIMHKYSAKDVKIILVRLFKEQQEREKEIVNPYSMDMPDYGKPSPLDPHTKLPAGAMPYIS